MSGQSAKAAFDLVAASLLLILCAPLFAVLALLIKLDSRGPVFFKQKRAGLNGKTFEVYKFRSMVARAEQLQGGPVTTIDSPYITRVGRFLRLSSLDELPQLYNVVRGYMSLVGPRPLLPESIQPAEQRRLQVKPGITGPVQIGGRQGLTWEQRMRLDLDYVDNWSLRRDARILLQTVPVVLSWANVYDAEGEMKARQLEW